MIRTRFAPSPTGFMHLGGLRTALYAYIFAKKNGGRFILRIEDTDQERYVEGATKVIYDTLRGCGLDWDEGPDIGGDFGPYIQSERKSLYLPYAKQLIESGDAYYCFCTKDEVDERRKAAEERGEVFKYDKHCLSLTKEEIQAKLDAGVPYVIRHNAPTTGETTYHDLVYGDITTPNDILDDMVLIKQDGMPTYNFANVVDDHLMQISHVIRGTEYLSSTPKYNLLYKALGWDIPEYIHLPPVMRDQHHKLSKRDGDAYFSDFVSRGYLPEALINYLALLGWNPGDEREFFTLSELQDAFSVKGINNAPAIFDIGKLTWFNFEYIRRLPFDKYLEMATPWFEKALGKGRFDLKRLAELMQIRTEVFDRIPDMVRFLAEMPEFPDELYVNKKMKTNPEVALENLQLIKPVLEGISDWTETTIHDTIMPVIAEAGKKNGAVLWPMRIAISGKENTPGGAFEIAYLIGKDETMRRTDAAIARLVSKQ
ncbi:MAG: glutamate--tRNA ligase [Eubacteriales bacterium]|nr:glutamate--tRNA ligase [Eubacteriales bacterium]MDD3883223.1 glutamate--tRNA ligase [Eubacteriales bacterium]MDD4513833.1 glutamate--tRNA ligase [Eubacteriales bacterium]